MADYDPVAPFYDQIHGSRKDTIRYIKALLKAYHPDAKNVLSLACGTGVICKALSSRKIKVTGLDISPDMILEAKKKLPRAQFYEQDMTDFDVPDRFDVITCLFASINHVLAFENWERLFERVKAHLNPGGIFVFDILTETCLYNMVLNSPLITREGKLVAIGDIKLAEEGGGTVWNMKAYEVTRKLQKELFSTSVRQVSFDPERIETALLKHFDQVLMEDPEQGEVTERSELIYFVAANHPAA